MEWIGLFFELLFLGMGVFFYLFAIGRVTQKDPGLQKQAEAFRQKNGRWIRPLALALIAIMIVNISLHVIQLLGR